MKKITYVLLSLTTFLSFGSKVVQAQSITPAADGTGTQINSPINNPNQLDITGGKESGANLFHSFEKFGLSKGQIANFLSNPSTRNILGKVVGGDASVINGLIQVTGGNSNLYLMNPSGIIFGSDASLNVPASFTATTANGIQIGDKWFKAMGSNNYTDLVGTPKGFAFTTNEPGSIFNAGNLTVSPTESISLVGGIVINTGTISTSGGDINIVAVPGEKLVRISQEGSLLNLDLPVGTKTEMNSGNQPLTALALPELLRGGNLNQASGVVVENGVVKLTASNSVIPNKVGTSIASGTLNTSTSSTGGNVYILGNKVGVMSARINASGANGGGNVLIGGDYKGQGTVPNAKLTYVSKDSQISVDALKNGDAGSVFVWADGNTNFYGNISAKGGLESGNGGFVEVSGKQSLNFRGKVDTSAVNGNFGTLLIDPVDIIIKNGSGDGNYESNLSDGEFQISSSDTEPTTIYESELEEIKGGTNITLEATNNIIIEDLSDDALKFQRGSSPFGNDNISINFIADADKDGIGKFEMNRSDAIIANNRNLNIEGANITVGNIVKDSGTSISKSVILKATNGNIISGDVQASEDVILEAKQGDITVNSINIYKSNSFSGNEDVFDNIINDELRLIVNTSGLFRVTGTVNNENNTSIRIIDRIDQNFIGNLKDEDIERVKNLSTLDKLISITHGGKTVELNSSNSEVKSFTIIERGGKPVEETEINSQSFPPLTIFGSGNINSFGFLINSANNKIPEGISGSVGNIAREVEGFIMETRDAMGNTVSPSRLFSNSGIFGDGGEIARPRILTNQTTNTGQNINLQNSNKNCNYSLFSLKNSSRNQSCQSTKDNQNSNREILLDSRQKQ